MKGSSETSARATRAQRDIGQSSARPQHTPTSAEAFALNGPSNPPDPDFNAYRQDLADVALIHRVIASHYAEPSPRCVSRQSSLRQSPAEDASIIRELGSGEPFKMLDDSLGWAWGYAGDDHRVGYVKSEALTTL